MNINWVDIIIVVYIVRAFFAGKKKGFSVEVFAFIFCAASLVTALNFYQGFGRALSRWLLLTIPTASVIAFSVIASCALFLGKILNTALNKVMKLSFLSNVEMAGGCIFGVLRGVCLVSVIVLALVLSPAKFVQQEVYVKSFFGNYLVALSPKIHEKLWPFTSGFSVKDFQAQLPG